MEAPDGPNVDKARGKDMLREVGQGGGGQGRGREGAP